MHRFNCHPMVGHSFILIILTYFLQFRSEWHNLSNKILSASYPPNVASVAHLFLPWPEVINILPSSVLGIILWLFMFLISIVINLHNPPPLSIFTTASHVVATIQSTFQLAQFLFHFAFLAWTPLFSWSFSAGIYDLLADWDVFSSSVVPLASGSASD